MRVGWLAPSCEQHSTFECNFSRRAHIDEANVQLLKKRSTSSPLFLSPPFCVSACFFWWSDSEYHYYVTTWKYKEYTLILYWLVTSNGLCAAIQQHHHARIRHRYFCPRLDLKCAPASKKISTIFNKTSPSPPAAEAAAPRLPSPTLNCAGRIPSPDGVGSKLHQTLTSRLIKQRARLLGTACNKFHVHTITVTVSTAQRRPPVPCTA